MGLGDRIEAALREEGLPLTTLELAERLDVEEPDVHRLVWDETERFVWQPGHRWYLARPKDPQDQTTFERDLPDSAELIRPGTTRPLHARTLANGLSLVVRARPIDSEALFTLQSQGNEIALNLNSAHQAFERLPLPFQEGSEASPFKVLLELMIEAWGIYESDLNGDAERRAAQQARFGWGRSLGRLIDEEVNEDLR